MNILYINNSLNLDDDTKCILKLCKELKNKNKIIVASSGGELVSEFINIGIKHYTIKRSNILFIIFNIIRIIKIVNEEKIQLIHSHHRITSFISKIVSIFTGVKVIHTQHICLEDKSLLTRFTFKNTNIISVSNLVRNNLIKNYNLDKSKITTIYNAIEIYSKNEIIDKILLQSKEKGYFTIGQVGRNINYEGIYDFIDIAKEVISINNNVRFFLIGDGKEREEVRDYIKDKNLEDYVFTLVSKDKDKDIEHLKYMDLMLLCYYVEELPLTPIEAFSQRIPVVSANLPGTNEEIINGVNGYLVPIKDIKSFAKRINELYYDEELYKSLKRGAYRSYFQNYTIEKYISSHLKFYKKVLKGK